MNMALPDGKQLGLPRHHAGAAGTAGRTGKAGAGPPMPRRARARVPLETLGLLGSKLPALVGLVCAGIDDLRGLFGSPPAGGSRDKSPAGPAPNGQQDTGEAKRIILRTDRLIRWTDKVRKFAAGTGLAGGGLTPAIGSQLESALAATVELFCGRIDALHAAIKGASPASTVRGVFLEIDRMIRWSIRLRGLVTRAKPEGAKLPGPLVARLEARLQTVLVVVGTVVDGLTTEFERDRKSPTVDQLISELERMLRWAERIKKLVERTKRTAPAPAPAREAATARAAAQVRKAEARAPREAPARDPAPVPEAEARPPGEAPARDPAPPVTSRGAIERVLDAPLPVGRRAAAAAASL